MASKRQRVKVPHPPMSITLPVQVYWIRTLLCLVFVAALFDFWVPPISMLTPTKGRVVAVAETSSWVEAAFELEGGSRLTCAGQSTSRLCPMAALQKAESTGDVLMIWHKSGKIWRVDGSNGKSIIDHDRLMTYQFLIDGLLGVLALAALLTPKEKFYTPPDDEHEELAEQKLPA
jgi:hypothetical protein